MTLYANRRSVCLLLIVAASLAVCHASEPRKRNTRIRIPVTAPNPETLKCVEMTYPEAPLILKAALIKATSNHTILDRVIRMADQNPNTRVKLSSTDTKRSYNPKYPEDSYEAPKGSTKPYYPSKPGNSSTITVTPDLSDVDPGRGITLQNRAFVLVADERITAGTSTPEDQTVQAGYGNLYAGALVWPAPFAVLASRTLLLKPVQAQPFVTITAANLAGGDQKFAVPTSYTMIGELVDDLTLETVQDFLPGVRQIPSPLGLLLAGLTEEKLPLSLYAAVGHVPSTSRVGIYTDDCLLDLTCETGGIKRLLVRGKATVTLAGTEGQPAFKKKSILVSQLNDNDWIPKGVVKVQCNLTLTQDEQELIDTGTCPLLVVFNPPVQGGNASTGF